MTSDKTLWLIWSEVNAGEYWARTYFRADNVRQVGKRTVEADGMRITVEEPIAEVKVADEDDTGWWEEVTEEDEP